MEPDFYYMLLAINKLFQNKYRQYISSKREIDGYRQTIVYRENNNPETKFSIEIIGPHYIWCSIPIKNSNYLYRTLFNYKEFNIIRVYEYLKLHIE